MGCDLEYFLDTDLHGLSGKEFIKKFEERAGEKLFIVDKNTKETDEAFRAKQCWKLIYDIEDDLDNCLKNSGDDALFTPHISYKTENKNDSFELDLYGKSISLVPDYNAHFGLLYATRYFIFYNEYFVEKNTEIIEHAKKAVENIKKKIAPILGSTKMIVYGDQIDEHEMFSNCLFEGDSIDEALEKSKDDLKNSPLLTESEMLSYVPNDEDTPLFLFDLTK